MPKIYIPNVIFFYGRPIDLDSAVTTDSTKVRFRWSHGPAGRLTRRSRRITVKRLELLHVPHGRSGWRTFLEGPLRRTSWASCKRHILPEVLLSESVSLSGLGQVATELLNSSLATCSRGYYFFFSRFTSADVRAFRLRRPTRLQPSHPIAFGSSVRSFP
jgi:hypothetical protein